MKYVVVKVPEKGDVSKSARFFENLQEAVAHADDGPYESMVVAAVLQDSWFERMLIRFVRFVSPHQSDVEEVTSVR